MTVILKKNSEVSLKINSVSSSFYPEEALQKYGKDNVKIYKATFTPMYYAVTTSKQLCSMKLITYGPCEQVPVKY